MTQVSCTPLGFPKKIRKMDIQVIHASANKWHARVCLVPVIPCLHRGPLNCHLQSRLLFLPARARTSFYFNRDTEIPANMCL